MQLDMKKASVKTMIRGAVAEQVDDAIQEVLDDIGDINKPPKEKRTVTLKIEFKSDEVRSRAEIKTHCSVSLAKPKPLETVVFIGKEEDGTLVGSEYDIQQPDLAVSKITKIDKEA
jgi:hypothetical protein